MRRPLAVTLSFAMCVFASACTDTDSGVTGMRSASAADSPAPNTDSSSDPSSTDPASPPSTGGGEAAKIAWQVYDDTTDVGSLSVPIDYDDPSQGNFNLFLARHNADPDKRIGTLLVNPGGPGFGGIDLALQAAGIYSERLLESFDIVAWDPRGTGLTTPAIDCIDDYDHYMGTDITPDDDAERQQIVDLAEEFEADCATKNADILQHVGTNDSARDIDSIRRALGEDDISYFGFSYGSELGATWATLFPETVRAAVLDGAVDPGADGLQGELDQAKGFEDAITAFLADCSSNSDCALHNDGDAEGAFDALMDDLDENPIPSAAGRPDIGRGEAMTAVAQGMYRQSMWPAVAQALADAQDGNGHGLLDLYDAYYHRDVEGNHDNNLEAFSTIYCMDRGTRLTVEQEDANAPKFTQVAPRYKANTTGTYMCTFFPETESPRIPITGAGAGPILVVGTTGDPATPLAGSRNMAKALEDGVLLVVEGADHTGYGLNQCSFDVVDDYLIDLTVPADDTRCG